MKAVLSTEKHTTSTIQKDLAKGVKNCVPKMVSPKKHDEGYKEVCYQDSHSLRHEEEDKKVCYQKVIPDVKNSNGDESFHGENVKSTIRMCAIKKLISNFKVNCRRLMSNTTGSASMKKRPKTRGSEKDFSYGYTVI